MPPVPDCKDPQCYSWIQYGWVIALSVSGAVVHYVDQNRKNLMDRTKLIDLAIDVIIAPFTGIVTFYLCESFDLEPVATAGVIGLISTLGTRGLYFIRKAVFKRIFNTTEIPHE
jgi:hypothetical protein